VSTVYLNMPIDPELRRALKRLALDSDTTLQAVVTEALRAHVVRVLAEADGAVAGQARG